MKALTIEKSAKALKYSVESVYELLGKSLVPSYEFKSSVEFSTDLARTIVRYMQGENKPARFIEMTGLFEISGYSEMIWDKNDYGELAGILLTKDGEGYLLAIEKYQIHKTELLITEMELNRYKSSTGRWHTISDIKDALQYYLSNFCGYSV